jgi:hypothetical protein
MLNYEKILHHVIDCIESEYESLPDDDEIRQQEGTELEKGLYVLKTNFIASLSRYENSKMDYHKFVNFNRGALIFETDRDEQSTFLANIGKKFSFDVETEYYRVIYPVFELLYNDFLKGEK